MSDAPRIRGLYAAPVTPVDGGGVVDGPRLRELIAFLLNGGVDGFCLGGGTSEYPYIPIEERKRLVEQAADQIGGRAPFVVAIGGPTVRSVVHLGAHAVDHGARALLIPMPYFYKYNQADLKAYVRYVTARVDHPCLLYNLAAYTNALEPATSLRLLREIPNLVGIKDSSRDKGAIRTLAEARPAGDWTLICGADDLILDTMEAGWDGIISGTACCCPELVAVLYRRHRNGNTAGARVAQQLLNELLATIRPLPGPWAIRVALEARGLPTGPFPFPVARERAIDDLRAFYESWFDEHLAPLQAELEKLLAQGAP